MENGDDIDVDVSANVGVGVGQVNGGPRFLVMEIFGPTFQGEGPLIGSKTLFIRFGGCDYRCKKCDSLHAVLPELVAKNALRLTADEIIEQCIELAKDNGTKWITLSGGNPAMWQLDDLCMKLLNNGFMLAVETQGTLAPKWLRMCQCVVVSPKGPGMGEKFNLKKFQAFMENLAQPYKPEWPLAPTFLKVVVFGQQDFEFALDVQKSALKTHPQIDLGACFLSLGNPNPPLAVGDKNGDGDKNENENEDKDKGEDGLTLETHVQILLQDYRVLMEDFLSDSRLTSWRFLPQLHVLAYSNLQGV